MARPDYYQVLGVSRQAGLEELKRAYRRLAIDWHPDRNPGSRLAEEKFKAIAEAYAVLSSPGKRLQYDRLGPVNFQRQYSREDIFQGFEPGDFFQLFGQPDAADVLSNLFSSGQRPSADGQSERLEDFFSEFGERSGSGRYRSADLQLTLQLSFKEAALGAEKCVAFNSAGGLVKVLVTVPPSSVAGQKIILAGQGPAQPGARPGNLVLELRVSPDEVFSRCGFDIQRELSLSPDELSFGCRPTVLSLSGQSLRLTVPAGSKEGDVFKIPGYGLAKPDGRRGDFLIKIKAAPD